MKVCGIIAEYNPLHHGHIYQLAAAREKSGCDHVIVVMSGSFVQRGDVAAYDKWLRTGWALRAGADLVLELPTVYALQGADGFAFGGVSTLCATGLLDALSFGSESENEAALFACAELASDPVFDQAVRDSAALGVSYPSAVQQAFEKVLPQYSHYLKSPNFTLGVAYLKVLKSISPGTRPVVIKRLGASHDSFGLEGIYSSASAFRRELSGGNPEAALAALPEFVAPDILSQRPACLGDLELPLLYRLRSLSPSYLSTLCGVDEGLENLLVRGADSLNGLLGQLKSKRYTLSRLRRMLCAVLLGISKEDVAEANNAVPYLRVLGMKKSAAPLLGQIAKTTPLPVITKKSDADRLIGQSRRMYELDCRAGDISALARADKSCLRDYTMPLILL